jgi:uncharacterized membrane protein YbhN (UPF0104 family)
VASLLVERLLDGLWLAAGFALTALFIPLPKNLSRAAAMLGVGVVAALVVFCILLFRGHARDDGGLLSRLCYHLRKIGLSRGLAVAALSSLLLLSAQAAAFWFVMKAYGLNLSFWTGAAVLLIVHLGTAIPNAPANVGSYQFFCVLGLQLFGIGKTDATSFSFVVFFLLTVPLWAVGFTALSLSGLGLGKIRGELRAAAA